MSEWQATDQAEWEQRWESHPGYSQAAMRPGAYRRAVLTRWTIALALLAVIAAGVWTVAVVAIKDRGDAVQARDAAEKAIDEAEAAAADADAEPTSEDVAFAECLADETKTFEDCDVQSSR